MKSHQRYNVKIICIIVKNASSFMINEKKLEMIFVDFAEMALPSKKWNV